MRDCYSFADGFCTDCGARERTSAWVRTRVLCESIAAHERGRDALHEAPGSTGRAGSTVLVHRGTPVFR